jgi:succinate dehydrogenase / fumarate reductase cytochrome b subunit
MVEAPAIQRLSVGKKILMAGSGMFLLLWITAHMLGNLKIWLGPKQENGYAAFLNRLLSPPFPEEWVLWIINILLAVAFVVHVYYAIVLSRQSKRARPVSNQRTRRVRRDPAALSMRWGGLTLALFLVFHLANLTWGWIHPGYTFVASEPYQNTVNNFQIWWMVVIYVVAMVALCLHIYHGSWSIFQTFGVNSRRWDRTIRVGSTTFALVIFVGFISIPIGIISGAIR